MGKTLGQLRNEIGLTFDYGGQGGVDFLTNETIIESGSAEKNINGDGKFQLSFKSTNAGSIPLGTRLNSIFGSFIMANTYVPSASENGVYTYSPSFISTDSLLSKTLFYKNIQTDEGEDVVLYTFTYAGAASTIVAELNTFSNGAVELAEGLGSTTIVVSFDGDSIKSAASKIANALNENICIIDGVIHIGGYNAYSADDYYNYFVVLGGTRNMGKRTISNRAGATVQYYAAVTKRLTIDAPGSAIDLSNGEPKLMKLLIFDDIYPKMELVITSVSSRDCYMMDDSGERIVDHWEGEGELRIPVYKRYKKFYITLGMSDGSAYVFDQSKLISGKPLGILFQSGSLTGREFDLAYFSENTTECEIDDVSYVDSNGASSGYSVSAGSYRIIMQADGGVLLPNADICPAVGDKITLTGMAMSNQYITAARAELLARGQQVANLYASKKVPSFQAVTRFADFLLEGSGAPNIGTPVDSSGQAVRSGSGNDDYIVTSVTTDLISGSQQVTFGTFKPKGLLQTLVDKVEGVSLSGGGATVGGEEYYRGTASMGIDQFNALRNAGGALGMVSVNQKINDTIGDIGDLEDALEEVKQQTDAKFDVWFGTGFPIPNKDAAEQGQTTSQYPASEWDTEEKKAQHVQDIYYDMSREPMRTGGRAWRWVTYTDGALTLYRWEGITDADTLASLEKLSDVASDGKLTGGAEKMRVYIDWVHIVEDFRNYVTEHNMETVPTELAAYITKFEALGTILNDGQSIFSVEPENEGDVGYVVIDPPAWLSQNLNDPDNIYSTTIIDDVEDYYLAWYEYYQAAAVLSAAIVAASEAAAAEALQTLADMANDNILTVIEKDNILREWQSVNSEKAGLVMQARRARITSESVYTGYISAFRLLATYLHDPSYSSVISEENIPDNTDTTFPAMLRANEDSSINGSAFNTHWKDYYDARSALMAAISVKRQSYFVGTDVPNPPYSAGDFWMKTLTAQDNKGTLMICITSKSENEQANESDWTEFAPNVTDYKILLCALAEKLYGIFGSAIFGKDLYFGGSPASALNDSLWYDASTGKLAVRNSGTWNYYDVDSADVAILVDSFRCVYDVLGARKITVYGERPQETPNLYDLYISPVTYTDSVTHKTLSGGIEILMYGENGWELLMKSINSVLENIGNFIRAIVFGSESGDMVTASGQIIGQKFVQLFSEAKLYDPENENADEDGYVSLTQALFGINVYQETIEVDGEEVKVWRSSAKLSADRIQFSGKEVDLSADQINFTGKIIARDPENNPTLQVDNEGNVSTRGNMTSAGVKAYSKMDNGLLEIGTVDSEGNEKPRYRVHIVEKNGHTYPVITLLDENQNTIGQIDESLFQTQSVEDSWFDRKFIKIVEGTTIFESIKDLEGTDYFCYAEGYTLAGGAKAYTSGGSNPSPTLNGHWFKEQSASIGNYMEDGSYVDKRTFFRIEKRGIRTYTQSYRKIYTVNQGVLEETERTLDSVWVLTGTIPPDDDGGEILDPNA